MVGPGAQSMTDLRRQAMRDKRRYRTLLLLYALPFVIFIVVFCYVPLAGWIIAFMKYKPGIPLSKTPFVGWYNFEMVFKYFRDVGRALGNTLTFSLIGLLTSPISVIFAIMLSELRSNKLRRVTQSLTTIPNFLSWVIVFMLTFAMVSTDGMVNVLLAGLGFEKIELIGNFNAVWVFQTCLSIWKGLGWSAIVYLAAIAGIDAELYDAAAVDGCNRLQKIWHITVPGVSETYLVLLILSVGSILGSDLDKIIVFYNPLVADRLETLDYYLYRIGLKGQDFSFSTAVGILKSIISITLLFVVNALSRKIRGYNMF